LATQSPFEHLNGVAASEHELDPTQSPSEIAQKPVLQWYGFPNGQLKVNGQLTLQIPSSHLVYPS